MSDINCSYLLTRGPRKGLNCGKKNCKYHEKDTKTEVLKGDTFIRICNVCNNKLDNVFSQIRMSCGHSFHLDCFYIFNKDEYGYIYKSNNCPVCNYDAKDELQKECSICLDNCLEDLKKLSCGHLYHKNCIDSWNKNNGCPMCRQSYN